MTKYGLSLLIVTLTISILPTQAAKAVGFANRRAARFAQGMSWHGPYYNTQYGVPLALVVPPTADMQKKYAWGVSQNTLTPIYHQFRRPYPGGLEGGGPLMPTPRWPSHSDQFGVYYVRGPW